MKEDHKMKDCRVNGKMCVHCGEKDKHYRTLCPKKFKQNEDQQRTTATDSTESGMVAIGEKVVMQTAMVTMQGENRTATARALFYTGSTRTYITEELMNTLKLKPIEEHTFSIYSFGNTKPKQKTSPVVELTIRTKIGKDIQIKATVTRQITGPLQRIPLQLKDQRNIQQRFQLADTLPSQIETYTLGLLIGNDHYYDIMLDERKRIQDNLFMVKSKLGWVMSGRASSEKVHQDETPCLYLPHQSIKCQLTII